MINGIRYGINSARIESANAAIKRIQSKACVLSDVKYLFLKLRQIYFLSQIGTAMIVVLLLHLKNKSNQDWYMSHLVTFIRIHLMSNIDMWERLKQRFEESHSPPKWTYT